VLFRLSYADTAVTTRIELAAFRLTTGRSDQLSYATTMLRSCGEIRTPDPSVNGRLLCQLSYAGMECVQRFAVCSARRAAGLRCGSGTRTRVLRLMRPAPYQLGHPAVAPAGLEPAFPP
jgi:hypothetical protein